MKDIFYSFYEASITLIPKPDKDSTLPPPPKTNENKNKNPATDRSISFMNIDIRMLNKTEENTTIYKNNYTHDQVGFIPFGFIPGIQGWFNV